MVSYVGFYSVVNAEIQGTDSLKLHENLKREAYYAFYLSDFLESATRLKMMETGDLAQRDPMIRNDVRVLLGSIYFAWGMDQTARQLFDVLVDTFPEGYDRNRILYQIARFEYAHQLYRHTTDTYQLLSDAVQFEKKDHIDYMAGMSYSALGLAKKATEILRAIPVESRYYPFAQYTVAQSHTRMQQTEEAVSILTKLSLMENDDDPVLKAFSEKNRLTLGLLHFELGDYLKAIDILAGMSRNSRYFPGAYYGVGWSHFKLENYKEALLIFQELRKIVPGNRYAVEALTAQANAYARLDARRAAVERYQEAIDAYTEKLQRYRELREWVGNEDRLKTWLFLEKTSLFSPIKSMVDEDDHLGTRVSQYRDLNRLRKMLERKLGDMDVFQVMISHRQSVYENQLPSVNRFLEGSTVKDLGKRKERLTSKLIEVGEKDLFMELLTRDERKKLNTLNRFNKAIAEINERIRNLQPYAAREKEEFQLQSSYLHNWASVLQGEILWKGNTEFPGRLDHAKRKVMQIEYDLAKITQNETRLVRSVPGLDGQLKTLHKTVQLLRGKMAQKVSETETLRERLFPLLQSLFVQAVDRRLAQYDQLTAAARLGQIQVLDVATQ